MDENSLKTYEVPQVVTYTDEQILDELGPAQTLYGYDSGPGPINF
jgi:hypothetical protein